MALAEIKRSGNTSAFVDTGISTLEMSGSGMAGAGGGE